MFKYIKLVIITVLVIGCEQVVDISPKSGYTGTVFVEGLLVVGETPRIYLMEALPFASSRVTPQRVFARGAEVIVSTEGYQETLLPDSSFNQFRCRWEPYYGGVNEILFGSTYHLEINYEGKNYGASTTTDQSKPTITSIGYNPEFYDIYGGHDGVNIMLKDPEGSGDFYRFEMNRQIDNSVAHAHILDVIQSTCTAEGEMFWVKDIGRTVFSDEGNDGQELDLLVEVSFEYSEGDSTWITMQSLNETAAAFYKELDDQLISIVNPFVEPVFLESKIDGGAVGFFGSAVKSDSVLFIYPQDNP
ncbi:MAG: hypothetical protein DHS20C17_03190 [Cyclobacteriaceae bacterium]|nr:MAG: hypothetical protein DHS20C17_03190 [Cyclobacteriaceae bacterium]